ncbi:hypothetical protein AB0P45_29285 [Streptomyces niveus]|uniref:hypothetical protein n=1 Tax=Streptomyces niveus TaxID=193462 RepID=UPI00343A001A
MTRHVPSPQSSAASRAGRLLCWTHTFAMLVTATEALIRPTITWWPDLWPLVWTLPAAGLAAWLACRVAERRRHFPATDEDDADPGHEAGTSHTSYDRAA